MNTRRRVIDSGIASRAFAVFVQVACVLLTLVVSNACGSAGASSASATGPAITTQPAPATVADGAVASFSVVATGDAPLVYQWRRSGVDLVDGAGIVGATASALALTAPLAFDKSEVSVRITNAAGAVVSQDALLSVTPAAPVITMQPSDATVMVGASATFTVAITGGTAPITYQWKRGGVAVPGATSTTYLTPATVETDTASMYSVDVINPVGTLPSNAAVLTVIAGAGAWGPVVPISSGSVGDAQQANSPVVAIDGSGNAIAAWQQVSAGREAVWANSADATGKWSSAAPIDLPTGSADTPRVVMTPSGAGMAVFGQAGSFGNALVTSRFAAGAWGAAQASVDGSADAVSAWQAGIAADGSAAVTFLQSDAVMPRVRAARSNNANVWSTSSVLDVAGGFLPRIAVAANGHAAVVWIKNVSPIVSELWSSRDIGAGWTTATMITSDTGASSGIEVTADASGNVIAIFPQVVSGMTVLRSARLDDATGTWSTPVTLSDGSRLPVLAKASVNGKGDAVVVWYEQGGGLYASRYGATTSKWSATVGLPMTVSPTYGPVPTSGIDDGGNAIVVWLQQVTGSQFPRVYYSRFVAGLGTWTTLAPLMTSATAYCAEPPAVSLDAKGYATAVWHELSDAPSTAFMVARTYR
jgi:hypothetical protein